MAIHRIAYENAFYHIMSRGNNRQEIFCDAQDRSEYLGILLQTKHDFGLKLFAYALMPNHVHLLLETPFGNISAAMKFLNWTYVRRFNCRHARSGHLFENRFKSKIVQRDRYFMAGLRYIHLNPVKAGLCSRPEEYPWSSHNEYLKRSDTFVNVASGLEFFDADPFKAGIIYDALMKSTRYEDEASLFDSFKNNIIGDRFFKSSIKSARKRNSLQPV